MTKTRIIKNKETGLSSSNIQFYPFCFFYCYCQLWYCFLTSMLLL